MAKLVYKRKKPNGGLKNLVRYNVERINGQPFGQIWTWKNTKDTWHPWHAKPLNGEHKTFFGDKNVDLRHAKAYMESCL